MTTPPGDRVVSSYTEWDPLEEVVVGTLEGALRPSCEPGTRPILSPEVLGDEERFRTTEAGRPYPAEQVALAQAEREEFVRILQGEGVVVRRPEALDHSRPFATPFWASPGGYSQANPRDVLVVIGDEIIEGTMCWRSRYFESFAYRGLLKEYFRRGARWTAAPKPQLSDALYDPGYIRGQQYVTTEFEPVFDAADIARCGRDIFVQRSHVTNEFGIEWLRRHLGDDYRIHPVEFVDERAIHIDATFVPIGLRRILVNPDRPMRRVPEVLKRDGWELLSAPRSTLPKDFPGYEAFRWLSMNILMLDATRVIVEKEETATIRAFKDWGFKPIPCSFRNNYRFGGGLHCATLDVRRRGALTA